MAHQMTDAEWRELESAIEERAELLRDNADLISSPKRRLNALVRAYEKVRELAPAEETRSP